MSGAGYQPFEFARDGGVLRGAVWGSGPRIVLASHGITANHWSFKPVADRLGADYRLIAIDHRGRGGSRDIAGPWGMDRHADDLIAVLDHLKVARVDVLAGHSMGGFVSAVAAARNPQRFAKVLLIDGGLPIIERIPWFMPVGLFLRLLLGPSMKRLDMRFESHQAYLDYWRQHPSLKSDWSEDIERYATYDLIGAAPSLRSGTVKDAVIGDTRSMLGAALVQDSLRQLQMPVRMLLAPRGIMNGKPMYNDAHLQRWAPQIKRFSSATVADVNHYTILMSPQGAGAIVQEIVALSSVA